MAGIPSLGGPPDSISAKLTILLEKSVFRHSIFLRISESAKTLDFITSAYAETQIRHRNRK